MTLIRARELLEQQMAFSSGYNRNAVRMILGDVARIHGQAAVDQLIVDFGLEAKFDLVPGTDFSTIGT